MTSTKASTKDKAKAKKKGTFTDSSTHTATPRKRIKKTDDGTAVTQQWVVGPVLNDPMSRYFLRDSGWYKVVDSLQDAELLKAQMSASDPTRVFDYRCFAGAGEHENYLNAGILRDPAVQQRARDTLESHGTWPPPKDASSSSTTQSNTGTTPSSTQEVDSLLVHHAALTETFNKRTDKVDCDIECCLVLDKQHNWCFFGLRGFEIFWGDSRLASSGVDDDTKHAARLHRLLPPNRIPADAVPSSFIETFHLAYLHMYSAICDSVRSVVARRRNWTMTATVILDQASAAFVNVESFVRDESKPLQQRRNVDAFYSDRMFLAVPGGKLKMQNTFFQRSKVLSRMHAFMKYRMMSQESVDATAAFQRLEINSLSESNDMQFSWRLRSLLSRRSARVVITVDKQQRLITLSISAGKIGAEETAERVWPLIYPVRTAQREEARTDILYNLYRVLSMIATERRLGLHDVDVVIRGDPLLLELNEEYDQRGSALLRADWHSTDAMLYDRMRWVYFLWLHDALRRYKTVTITA